MESITYSSFGKSDIGLVRQNNEDVFAALPDLHLYAIADGMGGYEGGEIAAHEAIFFLVRMIEEHFLNSDETPSTEELANILRESIKQASQYVFHLAKKNTSLQGMGTTLCTTLFSHNTLIHAHVGDSRLYAFRNGSLDALTKDHSLFNRLVDEGSMSVAEATVAAPTHILSRAVGTTETVDVDLGFYRVEKGDRFLLCSDGLTDFTSEEDIKKCLHTHPCDKTAVGKLIELAKSSGGGDNVTVMIITAKAPCPSI